MHHGGNWLSFRIKIPKGQTRGKNSSALGDRIREGQIEIYSVCLLPELVIQSHDITCIYDLQFHVFVRLDIGNNTTVSTILLNTLPRASHLLARRYYYSILQIKRQFALVSARFHVLHKGSICFLLVQQIYVMTYYPTVNVQLFLSIGIQIFFFRNF